VQPQLGSLRKQPHESVMGPPNLCGQLFHVAAGQFGVNARVAGISQFDLDAVKVDHIVPLSPVNGAIRLARFLVFCNCSCNVLIRFSAIGHQGPARIEG
jgi:hypothetical protein